MGSLGMPSAPVQQAGPIQQVQSGQVVQAPQRHEHHDLAQHEIRDRIANGGMSRIELQHKLQTDVFMTDLDRATYMEASAHLQPSPNPPAQNLQAPPTDVFTAGGASNLGGPAFHSQPIGGHDALGAEGSLAPQGLMSPQGFMTKVGMLGFVKGLMGIRSDAAKPGSMSPKQNNSSKSTFQPVQQKPQQQQQSAASRPNAAGSRPQQQGPAPSQQQQARPAAQQAPAASQGQASQGQSSAFAPVQSQYDSGQTFQPMQNGQGWFSQALWGNKHNPWAEVLNRIFALLKRMLGLEQGGGGKGGKLPPHMRGGGGH